MTENYENLPAVQDGASDDDVSGETFDAVLGGEDDDTVYDEPYVVHGGCLCISRLVKNSMMYTRLCTFAPRILSVVSYDDGADVSVMYRIGGTDCQGHPLPPVDVPVEELENMKWISRNWDPSCDLEVVSGVAKHVRRAIKSSGDNAVRESVFTHTGWTKINGEWTFLLPGKAGADVRLEGKSGCYAGTDSFGPADVAYMRKLLDDPFLSRTVLYPCLALVFLSPLNEFLRQAGCEPKFMLSLVGRTGSRKSTVAALMLSFFGRFSVTDLPMSFHDTPNSILHTAFSLKDVLTCIDDYHPTSRRDSDAMLSVMQTAARGYGDRICRNRLTPDCTLRDARPPQGNVIVTAEFQPQIGESGTARLFTIEMPPDCVDLSRLSAVQREAANGRLMRIMCAYTEHLKRLFSRDTPPDLADAFGRSRLSWQSTLKAHDLNFHGRLPDTLASLEIGFRYLLTFLEMEGRMESTAAVLHYFEEFRAVLLSLAEAQTVSVTQDKPTHIFVRKLCALLDAGRLTVVPRGCTDTLPATCVGYEDDDCCHLFFDMAHRAVRKMCEDQGEAFSISCISLGRALEDEGFLELEGCTSGHTHTIKEGGRTRRVLSLKKSAMKEVTDEQ